MSEPVAFLDGRVVLHPGDCLAAVRAMPSDSIDSVVTDPPYALVSIGKRFGGADAAAVRVPEGGTGAYTRASAGFMGKAWDTGEVAFAVAFWREVLRVLRPGGHVVAFGGTRTSHRLACAIEDAGFEIRDDLVRLFAAESDAAALFDSLDPAQRDALLRLCDQGGFGGRLEWCFGTGFPKSHDVSKGIDRHNGDRRAQVPVSADAPAYQRSVGNHRPWMADPAHTRDGQSAASAAWQGWGTALKPAHEPIILARKPLDGTVAETVLRHGTGALNIDGCRVEIAGPRPNLERRRDTALDASRVTYGTGLNGSLAVGSTELGRWPANLIHDGSDEVIAVFPDTSSGELRPHHRKSGAGLSGSSTFAIRDRTGEPAPIYGDSGSAARFYYSAKADAHDRLGSKHPTVKPVDLMRWLVRLVTPPGGTVLDPFAGTGTTGEAAFRERFRAVLVEREPEYQADIARRMALVLAGPAERRRATAQRKAHEADHGPLFQPAAE